jgi:hypothetical protein
MQVAGLRYYSPGIGRWASRDPIKEKGGTNLFLFARNEPVTTIDAVGKLPTVGNYHGNYCGDNRVNGLDVPQAGLAPGEIGPPAPGTPQPVDTADRCCMKHDRCFATVAMTSYPTANDRNLAKRQCDSKLMLCWSGSLCASDVALIDKLKIVVGIPAFVVAHPAYDPNPPGNGKGRSCCGGFVLFTLTF